MGMLEMGFYGGKTGYTVPPFLLFGPDETELNPSQLSG
jgi:hypothetical protein